MHIRAAHERDAPALSALAFEAKAHWDYSAAQLATWREDLVITPRALASHPCHVAELGSEVAGFCLLEPAAPHWHVEHLWVRPSCMARGVGRALLAHAAGEAARAGAIALAIDADPNAQGFYLRCGAVRVGWLAAPIDGQPDRERPQLLLAVSGRACAAP